jgi:c-di-GMP-binding flagellar brake protein YcgR
MPKREEAMNDTFIERRRYPRAAVGFKGVLETTSGDKVYLRTRNISGSGIYFYTEKKLTEFTEVSLTVLLPPIGKAEELSFRCAGVIVRVEEKADKPDGLFAAAVHFTRIDEASRAAICSYVDAVSAERKRKGR